ncbi:MAG: protein-L-isoaspartate(D-aspartate) O-methyltransferase [Candidatus Sulfopaludibacter sp.]|nr:protein-L-isoaspartate(D-aspartate) O-methyltransferase [Candidatus Sulfopaludibacter sp.]
MLTDFSADRQEMLDRQLSARGIRDERVLCAMSRIPREEFVPEQEREAAYWDGPIRIGYGQTISQPYMTALMAQELRLTGTEHVLEVGTGSGYAAALLGLLARDVITVELVPELAETARATLLRTGYGLNVMAIAGDGSWGYPDLAPYDGISVAAGAPEIPAGLLVQLAERGRMVIPVGPHLDQELLVVEKERGRIRRKVSTMCSFVPLLGIEGWQT